MATGSTRDVSLNIGVKVAGTDDVAGLSAQLRETAKAGGAAAPEFQRLADELDKSAAASEKFRTAERAAVADVAASKAGIQAKKDALKLANIESDNAVKKTAEFQAATRASRLGIFEEEKALRTKREVLQQATSQTTAATAAEKTLAAEIRASLSSAKQGVAETKTAIDTVSKSASSASDVLRQIGPLVAGAFSARQFIEVIATQESLNRGFEQIFGSTEKARIEMNFIRASASKLGLENQSLAKSYQSLSASTKGTVLEGQATRDVFEAVARAMSTLGKSSADTDRALTAISQIASKGVASMEELRGQLGEALPGALKAAADGAGITTEQLIAMVSTGSVLASDILPSLTRGLNEIYGKGAPPATIVSEWARFKNVLSDTAIVIGEGGASKGIARLLSGAALAAQGAAAVVDILGSAVGETTAALATGNLALGTGEELYGKYADALRAGAEQAGFAEKAQNDLTAAQDAAAGSAQASFRQQELAAQKLAAVGETLLALKVRYNELSVGAAQYSTQQEKNLAASTAESAAVVQLVNVYGSEIEKRQIVASVADQQAEASRRLAQAREAEAIIAVSLANKLKEEALRRGDTTEATRKEVEAAERSAAAKNAEASQSAASARGKVIEAEATKAAAAAYADNSARVTELRGAAAAAALEVERLTRLQKEGKATDEQVSDARAKASAATLLYRDALKDASEAAERNLTAQRQAAQLAQAGIAVDLERVKAQQEVAAANGNATKSAALLTQATDLQVRASRDSAAAAFAEAQAIRDAADTKERELKATGELTTAKKAEIETARKSADLKDLEGQKADILAEKIRALASSESARTAVLEQQITAEEKRIALMERQQALENKRLNRDKEGYSLDTAGNRVNVAVPTKASIYEQAKSAGLTEAQALKLSNDTPLPYNGPGLRVGNGFDNGENWGTRLQDQINALKLKNAQLTSQTPVGNIPTAGSKTVNIVINGRNTPVNVASQSDSDALTAILRQLESAAGTAR